MDSERYPLRGGRVGKRDGHRSDLHQTKAAQRGKLLRVVPRSRGLHYRCIRHGSYLLSPCFTSPRPRKTCCVDHDNCTWISIGHQLVRANFRSLHRNRSSTSVRHCYEAETGWVSDRRCLGSCCTKAASLHRKPHPKTLGRNGSVPDPPLHWPSDHYGPNSYNRPTTFKRNRGVIGATPPQLPGSKVPRLSSPKQQSYANAGSNFRERARCCGHRFRRVLRAW